MTSNLGRRHTAAPVPNRGRLARELAEAVSGEVRFDRGALAVYANDASIYRQVPIGAVIPRDAADVVAAVAVCREHEVPVLSRGCGTALAGQSVNAAVVFDFSKYMHDIVEIDVEARTARVQPGVICDQLRDAAAEHGLTFAVDPATHSRCTFGGMIGNNSCGTSFGNIAARAGRANVTVTPFKNSTDNTAYGKIALNHGACVANADSPAITSPHSASPTCVSSRIFRRLNKSANCPAGSDSSAIGMNCAIPSSPSISLLFVRVYSSQSIADSWICPPTTASE